MASVQTTQQVDGRGKTTWGTKCSIQVGSTRHSHRALSRFLCSASSDCLSLGLGSGQVYDRMWLMLDFHRLLG